MISRKQIVVLSLRTLPLLSRLLVPSASNERTRHNRLFVFRKRRGYGYGRLCVTFPTAIARRVNTTYDARCLKFAEGMAAPRWSPAPRRGRKLVARGGAARRGKAKRGGTKRSETRRREAKRGEERRDEAKSTRTYMYPRDVCAPTASIPFCVDASTCVCGSVLARRCPCPLFVWERARQSRSTRAKGIDGAAAKLPDHYSIGATSSETLLYDRRRYRSRPRAHVQFRARTRAIAEKERERERESASGTNQRRESKRVRTMYARYGSMTYYEQVDGRARGGTCTAGT